MALKLPDFFDNARMKWVKRSALFDIEREETDYFKECAAQATRNAGKSWFHICHGPYVLSLARRFKTILN
jgi:hypothetical protein